MAPPCTDTFAFNKNPLFQALRKCLPQYKRETQNLVATFSNMLYAWDSENSCVLALNWRSLHIDPEAKVKVQSLNLSDPLYFVVDKITVSPEGTLLALSGTSGVSYLELPQVWSSSGMFHDGRESIMCKVHNLDERFFMKNPKTEVKQVRFHPASPNDSQLLVLLSNNTMRIYNEFQLSHVWIIGPEIEQDLGETGVDFDFAPPRVSSSENLTTSIINMSLNDKQKPLEQIEWPIVILRGNGSVSILCAGLDTERPQIQALLKMVPQAEDNYGTDSCSLIVIQSSPATIVIAESTGKLYHCLLMSVDNAEDSFNESDEWYIHVLEVVELDLGLHLDARDKGNNCPIFLKRDAINESRYYAYHNTGLHAVSMNFVRSLQELKYTDDEHAQFSLYPSGAEYLVCTKALDSNKTNAILGFFLLESPNGLALFLASGQVVSLNITAEAGFIIKQSSSTDNPKQAGGGSEQSSFEAQIQHILKGVTHPLLVLDKTQEPTSLEALQLLLHATQVLREQYFPRHEKARNEIAKRVKFLIHSKQQQQKKIEELQAERTLICENAERFSDMYEEIAERQQQLFKRAQQVVQMALERLPYSTLAEKEFGEKIEKMSKVVANLQKSFEMSNGKMSKQEMHIDQYLTYSQLKQIYLPEKQHEMIKGSLQKMGVSINSLAKDVKEFLQVIN